MVAIPNTEYITVKRDKKGQVLTFVGGHPATTYRDKVMEHLELVKEYFSLLQKHNPQITEIHAGAFATRGEYAKAGNPDAKFGPYMWFRMVSKELSSPWVFDMMDSSAVTCARNCVYYCLGQLCANWEFRRDVFQLIDKKHKKRQNKYISLESLIHIMTTDKQM